jgi:hypothetical protein
VRKEELDKIAGARPFKPFEVRLVDGRTFRFNTPEGFVISRSALTTLDKEGELLLISLPLIATVNVRSRNGGHRAN